MLNIVDLPEKLWQECAKLAKKPLVIASEIYNQNDEHFVLAYGPVAQRNKYQELLYSAHEQFNVSVLPIHDLSLCGEIPWPGKVICHFHWIHEKTHKAKTRAEAEAAVVYWQNLLCRIKDNGHKILWTVHNVMPHETVWIEQDKKIHQIMADAADAIHVMASDSAELTELYYKLDKKKIFLVPHPIYEGAQPNEISRTEARTQLKIDRDDFVFLSFGAIMEYKGYDRLMKAYEQLRIKTKKKCSLIIAGLPTDKKLVDKISSWGKDKKDVILDMTPIPNDKLQVYFRSADFAVCPYYRTMNSGAAMMALTFDLPVLGPNSGGFLDLEKMGCGVTFDNTSDFNLFKKMESIIESQDFFSKRLLSAKADLMPSAVSKSFFEKINKTLVNYEL